MKKNFRKTAVLTFIVLLGAIMSLASVSYAWFTASNTVVVDPIDVNIQSAGGLEIAAKPVDGATKLSTLWRTTFTPSTTSVKLMPVSGNPGTSANFYTALFEKEATANGAITDYFLSHLSVAPTNGEYKPYILLEFALRNADVNPITIDFSQFSVSGASSDALRVAFYTTGSKDYNPTTASYNVLETSNTYTLKRVWQNSDDDNLVIIGTDSEATTLYSQKEGYAYTKVARSETEGDLSGKLTWKTEGNATGFFSYVKDDDYKPLGKQDALTRINQDPTSANVWYKNGENYVKATSYNGTYDYYELVKVDVYTKDTAVTKFGQLTTTNSKTDLVTIEANSYIGVMMYIWVEGQDPQCDNTLSGQSFSLDLRFNASPASQG